jgi:hypothetical protein
MVVGGAVLLVLVAAATFTKPKLHHEGSSSKNEPAWPTFP